MRWPRVCAARSNIRFGPLSFLPALAAATGAPAVQAGAAGVFPGAERASLNPLQPNPAHGTATLAFDLAKSADARIRVFDVAGRTVAVNALGRMGPGAYRLPLPGAARLSPGVYVVKLTQGGNEAGRRFVVLK